MSRSVRMVVIGAVVLLGLLAVLLRRGAERDADNRGAVQAATSESAPIPVAKPLAVATPIAPVVPAPESTPAPTAPARAAASNTTALPRLVDVGAGTCIPCKMMAPILSELGREYAGVFQVDVYDLRQDREAATQYGVRVIPTQVFYDAGGRELFRHEGFFAKEEILAKWRELGVKLPAPAAAASRS